MIGLHHVGRAVRDVEAAARDLTTITGWELTRAEAGESPFCVGRDVGATAMAHGPNGWIELIGATDGQPTRRPVNVPGVTHSSIQTGDPDALLHRIEEGGLDRQPGPIELGTGFTYQYVRDLEGNVVEVEGAPHAPSDLEPWLSHGAIATPGIERLADSYGALLDAAASPPIRLRNHRAFDRGTELEGTDVLVAFVKVHNGAVELWQYDHPAPALQPVRGYSTAGAGHLAFETDDMDGSVERALAAGFELIDEPTTSCGIDIARLTDPDGNWVELVHCADDDDRWSLRSRPDPGRPARMDAILAGQQR